MPCISFSALCRMNNNNNNNNNDNNNNYNFNIKHEIPGVRARAPEPP